jgi:hypothetical protein
LENLTHLSNHCTTLAYLEHCLAAAILSALVGWFTRSVLDTHAHKLVDEIFEDAVVGMLEGAGVTILFCGTIT